MKRFRWLIWSAWLLYASVAAAVEAPKGMLVLDGRPAPKLKLADMEGKVVDLTSLRGQWVLVHFWASWCGPCRKEMPTLDQLSKTIPAEKFRILLVNTAETDDEVFSFLPTVSPDLNALMDRDGKVTERWQPRGLPSSFIVDPQGRLRYLALGGRDWMSTPYLDFIKQLSAQSASHPKHY